MKKYTINSFSGYFYVNCATTGKLLIPQSFRSWDDAERAAKRL